MTALPEILSEHSKEEIIETLNEIRNPIEIAICGSENYFNLGSVIRTCHNFLVKTIYLVDVTKFYKKATMGAHKYENIVKLSTSDFKDQVVLNDAKSIVAFERRPGMSTEDLRGFSYPTNPVLVFGSEKDGVPEFVLENASNVVSIPVQGINNDFNLANAAAIGIYDWYSKYSLGS